MIAATRIRKPSNGKPGGVTIIENRNGRLASRSEFTPPDGIDFSPANNVAFTADASTAFVGSATGILFAFNTGSGELESYQEIGSEIRRVALSEKTHSIAAVRSSSSGDIAARDGQNPPQRQAISVIRCRVTLDRYSAVGTAGREACTRVHSREFTISGS